MKIDRMTPKRCLTISQYLLFLFLSSFFACQINAGVLAQGAKYNTAENYASALKLYKHAAEKGDREGEFGLGVLYYSGLGVEKNHRIAVQWFAKSAKKGLPQAQFNYGNAFHRGEGVAKSLPQALYWWRKAADQTVIPAMMNLAAYFDAREDEWSKALSIAWLRRAAQEGLASAERNLDVRSEPKYLDIETYPRDKVLLASEAELVTYLESSYILQFAALTSIESAIRFIERYSMGGNARIFRKYTSNGHLIIVAFGSYGNKEEAVATISSMKPELKSLNPWVRPVSSVHKILKNKQ